MDAFLRAFLFAIATHQAPILVDNIYACFLFIKGEAWDRACIHTPAALNADGFIEFDLEHLFSHLQPELTEFQAGIF
jgi:hypothetical protein